MGSRVGRSGGRDVKTIERSQEGPKNARATGAPLGQATLVRLVFLGAGLKRGAAMPRYAQLVMGPAGSGKVSCGGACVT